MVSSDFKYRSTSQRVVLCLCESKHWVSGSLKSFLCVCLCVCCDETLYLTQCCSVKVKPYRMSGMMTCTERFHLISPFPLFLSVPPICLFHLHLRPGSLTRRDRHTLAFTYHLRRDSLWVCWPFSLCACKSK